MFHYGSYFVLGERAVVLDLLYEDKLRIVVETMVVGAEVLIEGEPGWLVDIAPVGVEALMSGWFRFSHILVVGAFRTVCQIEAVGAAAIELVLDGEGFAGGVAREGFSQ